MKPLTAARRSATGGWVSASAGWWLLAGSHPDAPVLVGATAVVCTLGALISAVNGFLEASK